MEIQSSVPAFPQLEHTPTPAVVDPGIDIFATRPTTNRRHSYPLFGASAPSPDRASIDRGLDVVMGMAIGAALVYYFLRRG